MEQQRTHVIEWQARMSAYLFSGPAIDTYRARRDALALDTGRKQGWSISAESARPPKPKLESSKPKRRVKTYSPEMVQRVRELFGLGLTYASVREETGVCLATLQKMRAHQHPYEN
jgi:hypothetical protein